MVFVISKDGEPLMPTKRHGKVRILLKCKLAKVVKTKPFTIQLTYETTCYTQPITLGIDSGYTYIGFSAVTEKEEVLSGEVTLLTGQKERLKEKKMYRKQRRSRKRYRKCRFDNRKKSKPKGWLAPSIQHKLDSHIRFIEKIKSFLPISKMVVEVANFDTQKLKNPSISGDEYQNGEQKGFWNLRKYILHRDNHTCQLCGKQNTVFEVHHIGFWKGDRSNRPANLMTLCTDCHRPHNHQKGKKLWGIEPKQKSFKEATFMTAVRWRLVNTLQSEHTYGYITQDKRITLGLPKAHHQDAFVIAGGNRQTRTAPLQVKQVRRNNRSLEKFYDAKYIDSRTGKKETGSTLNNGRRTRNKNLNTENLHKYRQEKVSKGRRAIRRQRYFYQPNDLVKVDGVVYTVKGTQNKGNYVKLQKGETTKVIPIKKITPYQFCSGIVWV